MPMPCENVITMRPTTSRRVWARLTLYASRLVREYRAEMARHREEMLRQQWESMQDEREAADEREYEHMRT